MKRIPPAQLIERQHRAGARQFDEAKQQEFFSRRELAEYFGKHTETIKRWERSGLLPAHKINSRLTLYSRGDIEAFLSSTRYEPPA